MRKFLACSIVALGIFALAACGSGGGGTKTGGGSTDKFCDVAKDVGDKTEVVGSTDLPGDDELDEALDAVKDLAEASPEEIGDEMKTISDVSSKVVSAVKKAGDDDDKRLEAAGKAVGNDEGEFGDALVKVAEYAAEECDAELFGMGGVSTDASDFTDFSDDFSDFPTDLSDFDCEDYASSFDLPSSYCDDLSDLSDFDFSDFSDFDFSDMLSDFSDFGSGN